MTKYDIIYAAAVGIVGGMFSFAVCADDASNLKSIQQVFGQKIIAEMNIALACQMEQERDRQKITALEQRVKELETKYEPKPQ